MSDFRNPASSIYHGTTTVGLVCSDGTVLATDTRAIAGPYFIAHRNVKKIQKIDEHLGMTIAGGVADAQNVVDTIRYYANIYRLERGIGIPVKAAARLASNIFFSSRLFPYIADVIVAGYEVSGPSVYNIDLFGSLTEEKYISTGSGSPVAYGILESEYREGISAEEGVRIAVKAVTAAMKRNAGTGDSFDVTIIDRKGFRDLTSEEKTRIVEAVARRA